MNRAQKPYTSIIATILKYGTYISIGLVLSGLITFFLSGIFIFIQVGIIFLFITVIVSLSSLFVYYYRTNKRANLLFCTFIAILIAIAVLLQN